MGALSISLFIKAIRVLSVSHRQIPPYHMAGFISNDLLRNESNETEIHQMCNDLAGMIFTRIDYLFEQNFANLGYFAEIQLLICLRTCVPDGNFSHQERVKEISQKLEIYRRQLDKKTTALYNYFLEMK